MSNIMREPFHPEQRSLPDDTRTVFELLADMRSYAEQAAGGDDVRRSERNLRWAFERLDALLSVTTFYAVKIEAQSDPGGNPQRGWMIYSAEGAYKGFADEGYRGSGALWAVLNHFSGKESEDPYQRSEDDGSYVAHGPNGTVRLIELGIVDTSRYWYHTVKRSARTSHVSF